MGYDGKVRTIRRIHEKGKAGDETKHSPLSVGIGKADGKLEHAHDDPDEGHPQLLAPDRTSVPVDDIAYHATGWPEHNIEEAKHRSPATSLGLPKIGEVVVVVGRNDRIESEFTA